MRSTRSFRPRLLALLSTACSDYGFKSPADATAWTDSDTTERVSPCAVEAPPGGTVAIDATCSAEGPPLSGSVPELEWEWRGKDAAYAQVMMTPVVGDVDGDGRSEIVFVAYGTTYGAAGALVILSGDDGTEELLATEPGGYAPMGASGVALGDLEGDGVPEIVYFSRDSRVVAVHADGSLVWRSEASTTLWSYHGAPAIADLDGDGLAEVVAGKAILDHTGLRVGNGTAGWGGWYGIPVVADLDGDGQQEVVVGNAAVRRDGSAIWTSTVNDGYPAVADFDGDGQGEVVSAGDGMVTLLDTDGTTLWGPIAVPGGRNGPPTVADFDADGAPEIGTAGEEAYYVYDTDGTLLWEAATYDVTSGQTGSSVFDFDDDGQAEVIYADELALWVLDGATGAPLVVDTRHSSWTLFEYPVIADTDGDGAAEIVLPSNDSIHEGWHGISVLGSGPKGLWAPAAPVWNQHGYSITNVEDDLGIPAVPPMNWTTGQNSFRQGGTWSRAGIPAPDLQPSIVGVCWICEGDHATVEVAVQAQNTGTSAAAGVRLTLQAERADGSFEALGEAASASLDPGVLQAGTVIVAEVDDPSAIAGLRLSVDGSDATGSPLKECDPDDNRVSLAVSACR
jgi:hypothetical protein